MNLSIVIDQYISNDGEDVYPFLEEAMTDRDTYRKGTVRFEMMRHFGAFPTESSHHLGEYLPYFRTDRATIEEMTGEGYAERMATATYLEGWKERSAARDEPGHDVERSELKVERSEEYASRLIQSLETGQPRRFDLNVPDNGSAITNLPREACVEEQAEKTVDWPNPVWRHDDGSVVEW